MAIEDFPTYEGTPVIGYVCVGVPNTDTGYGWEVVYFDDPDFERADWARRMWLRQWRDMRLTETDWMENPSVPMTEHERDAWKAYRQQLRDLPGCGCSISVECPVPPCFDESIETNYIPWRINGGEELGAPPKSEGWQPPPSMTDTQVIDMRNPTNLPPEFLEPPEEPT